jgi:hypothetical protein
MNNKNIKVWISLVFCSSLLLSSCGSSDPQADICGSYNKWNWYRYNARNADNFDQESSWSNLAENEFTKLGEKSRQYSGMIDEQLDTYLRGWLSAGYSGDYSAGQGLAAAFFVRCDDLGYEMDLETLK